MFYANICYHDLQSKGCWVGTSLVSKSTIKQNIDERMANENRYYRRMTEATFNYFWKPFIESNFGTKYNIVFNPDGNGTDEGEMYMKR